MRQREEGDCAVGAAESRRPDDEELAAMETEQLQQRVKVYKLNDEGVWADIGTGHVSVEDAVASGSSGQGSPGGGLLLVKRDDGEMLLRHQITTEDVYKRQSDTIISWAEAAANLALSFQETMGCTFVWENICSVQRQMQTLEAADGAMAKRQGAAADSTGQDRDNEGERESARGANEGAAGATVAGGPEKGGRGDAGAADADGDEEACSPSRAAGMAVGRWAEDEDEAMQSESLNATLDAAFRVARSIRGADDVDSGSGGRGFRGAGGGGGDVGDGDLADGPRDGAGTNGGVGGGGRGGGGAGGSGRGLLLGHPDAELPMPEMGAGALEALARSINDVSPFGRERVAGLVQREGWLRRLFEVFHMSEDVEDEAALAALFRISRGLVLLNDGTLLDTLLDGEYVMDLMGALEYDPEVAPRPHHRKFLAENATFKEVVPIADPAVRAKIHQTFRIGYLKDVVLARALDDATFATLNSLVLFNNVEVVTALQRDPAFMEQLFSRLSQVAAAATAVKEWIVVPPAGAQPQEHPATPPPPARDAEPQAAGHGELPTAAAVGAADAAHEAALAAETLREWRDLVLFLQELAGLSRHLQPSQRGQLLLSMVQHGLFDILTHSAASPDEAVQRAASEVMVSTMTHDPQLLRSFLVNQPDSVLYGLLVRNFIEDSSGGLQAQLLEMLRALMDPETMDQTGGDKGAFLDKFYDRFMDQLVAAVCTGRSPFAPDGTVVTTVGSLPATKAAAVAAATAAAAAAAAAPAAGCGAPPAAAVVVATSSGEQRHLLPAATLGYILELLCFCVQQHGFRIKYYILRHNVVDKILRPLARRRERSLVVAAVRFFRTCIGLKDEFYHRYIIRQNLFDLIVQVLVANGNRYNLLNSAILELFEFIRKSNLKGLICHIWEGWGEQLQGITYTDVFHNLRIKYEQIQDGVDHLQSSNGPTASFDGNQEYVEGPPTPGAVSSGVSAPGGKAAGTGGDQGHGAVIHAAQRRRREGSMDQEEEDYFNQDDGDGPEEMDVGGTSLSPPRPPLVLGSSPPGPSGGALPFRGGLGLVDYDDDEEESFATATSPSRATSPPLRGEGRVTSSARSLSPGRLGAHQAGGSAGRGSRGRGISISISSHALPAPAKATGNQAAGAEAGSPLGSPSCSPSPSPSRSASASPSGSPSGSPCGSPLAAAGNGAGGQESESFRPRNAAGGGDGVQSAAVKPEADVASVAEGKSEARGQVAQSEGGALDWSAEGDGTHGDLEAPAEQRRAPDGTGREVADEMDTTEGAGPSSGAEATAAKGPSKDEVTASSADGGGSDPAEETREPTGQGGDTDGGGNREKGDGGTMEAGEGRGPAVGAGIGDEEGAPDSNGVVFAQDSVDSSRMPEGGDGAMTEPFTKRRRRDDVNALMVNT